MNRFQWYFSRHSPLYWIVTLSGFAVIVAFLYGLFSAVFMPGPPPWYTLEVATDNGFHPVHLSGAGDAASYDLLMVKNLSSKPLCVYAFSSRPRDGSAPEDIMTSWARWITVSKQAITVEPGCTWILKPGDTSKLPFIHGHTWLTCFFEPSSPGTDPDKLPAAQLPDGFRGRFQLFYVPSSLVASQLSTPQLYLSDISAVLAGEIDTKDHALQTLPPADIRCRDGLTTWELR